LPRLPSFSRCSIPSFATAEYSPLWLAFSLVQTTPLFDIPTFSVSLAPTREVRISVSAIRHEPFVQWIGRLLAILRDPVSRLFVSKLSPYPPRSLSGMLLVLSCLPPRFASADVRPWQTTWAGLKRPLLLLPGETGGYSQCDSSRLFPKSFLPSALIGSSFIRELEVFQLLVPFQPNLLVSLHSLRGSSDFSFHPSDHLFPSFKPRKFIPFPGTVVPRRGVPQLVIVTAIFSFPFRNLSSFSSSVVKLLPISFVFACH